MIDEKHPDFHDTPASDSRPTFHYAPAETRDPLFSIVTPYYNTGPVFWDTFHSIQRMSIPHWEWLIVDDGSTREESIQQLQEAQAREPRIRVIRQANGGPAVARNHAAHEAWAPYLLLLDSDDMVEPTFVEKCLWFFETQPTDFAALNSYNVSFGTLNILWPRGFDYDVDNVRENLITPQSMVRTTDYLRVGGFDETIRWGHEDWDFWLKLAEIGLWGYTLPEYLTWYRLQEQSRVKETEDDLNRAIRFRRWLDQKHKGLVKRFPKPQMLSGGFIPPLERHARPPFASPLAKPAGARRVLLLAPSLGASDANQFNLDMLARLKEAGYEFTVVTTQHDQHDWLSRFSHLTPDVFCLDRFLILADYPRFISYLIESRQVDAALVTGGALNYALLPYLRTRHPQVALLDYTRSAEVVAPQSAAAMASAQARDALDLRLRQSFDMAALRQELDASFSRACAQATGRVEAPDVNAACALADGVMRQFAPEEGRRDALARKAKQDELARVRRTRGIRRMIVPEGTWRFAAYKNLRQALGSLRGGRG